MNYIRGKCVYYEKVTLKCVYILMKTFKKRIVYVSVCMKSFMICSIHTMQSGTSYNHLCHYEQHIQYMLPVRCCRLC